MRCTVPAAGAGPGHPGGLHGRDRPAGGGGDGLAAHDLRRGTHVLPLGGRGDIRVEHIGTAVHDCFASYLSWLLDETAHGLCNAHLLRNLEEIVELEKEPDGWAACMQRLLLKARDDAVHWCDTTGGPVPPNLRAATKAAWDALLVPVLDRYGRPADGAAATTWPLALWELRDACLLFMADPRVPFTNNLAEQALRRAKLQMKISGGFRTQDGAERFAPMRGLAETARKWSQVNAKTQDVAFVNRGESVFLTQHQNLVSEVEVRNQETGFGLWPSGWT